MSLWVCRQCTTAYAVGLAACPQCGSTQYTPDWEVDVPNIIVGVGPWNDRAQPGEVGYMPPGGPPAPEPEPEVTVGDVPPAAEGSVTVGDVPEVVPDPLVYTSTDTPVRTDLSGRPATSTPPPSSEESSAPDDGGAPSAGTSSSTSASTPSRSSSGSPPPPLSPALTTGSPSSTALPPSPAAEPSSSASSTGSSTPATGSGPSSSDGA